MYYGWLVFWRNFGRVCVKVCVLVKLNVVFENFGRWKLRMYVWEMSLEDDEWVLYEYLFVFFE